MNKQKSLRFPCYKCDARFKSHQARLKHEEEDHKPPIKTVKQLIRTEEYHRLINGSNLKLGDRVEFNKSGFISKITTTEGSNVTEVEVSVIDDSWKRSTT